MTQPAPFFVRTVLDQLPALRGLPWLALAGGRTNRLWRVGQTVVKAYDPAAATPLFPNDAGAELRALALLGPRGLAPRLIGAGDGWLAYAHIDGQAWQSGPATVAQMLARLHEEPGSGFRAVPSGSAAILEQARAIAAACRTALPPAPRDPHIAPVAVPRLIHGDAVAGNLIDGPQGVTLIDWQCPGLGDATEDLALFLSPAMQWLYRGRVLSDQEVAAFLAAYPDSAVKTRYRHLRPLYRWRMAAHCLWKAERGARDYGRAMALETAA
jgi:aminoglycoside phosphotransferase (APT) family kinase protein